MNAVKQFTDMITNDDIQLPLPELEQVPVPVPITDRQKEEMENCPTGRTACATRRAA